MAQQMTDCAVTVTGFGLGSINGFIHRQATAGCVGKTVENEVKGARAGHIAYDTGNRDGAGIHHWIERAIGVRIKHNGVESIAARFDPDPLQDRLAANELQRETIDEGLRHRLDRERMK